MSQTTYLHNVTDTLTLTNQYLIYIERIEQVAATTVKNRRYILLPFFRTLGISDVTQISLYDIDEYFMHRTRDKRSTTSSKRQVLRSFFQYCQEYREINLMFAWHTIHRVKTKSEKVVPIPREDVNKVVQSCLREQDRLMIALMFETGMRIGEVLKMKIEDMGDGQIRIRGKGSNDRLVFMSPELTKRLDVHRMNRGIVKGCYFRPLQRHNSHPSDRYISAYSVRDRIEREFKRFGIDMHPHVLRHSFAVDWLDRGGDIRTLQTLLGHESIETTQWYLNLTDRHRKATYLTVFSHSVLTQSS